MLTPEPVQRHAASMEWLVEFEGRQMPMDTVRSDDFAPIVGPLRSTIERALVRAVDLDELHWLKIVVYAEDGGDTAVWGLKYEGRLAAVNYAVSLMGDKAPIVPPTH